MIPNIYSVYIYICANYRCLFWLHIQTHILCSNANLRKGGMTQTGNECSFATRQNKSHAKIPEA